jgi:2-oxo-4-hydroxy-4-carboxy-5-ureidoimidazoline decarboxylase
MTIAVAALDAMPGPDFRHALGACCGAAAWVSGMEARRPFHTRDALLRAADEVWNALTPADWLEAFAHHPRIGERRAAADTGDTARQWSAGEQARAMDADAAARAELADAQREYEARFGHIFLICAAGRTAAEVLAALRGRIRNAPDAELRVAAEEQRKITRLRLEKLTAAGQHAGSTP